MMSSVRSSVLFSLSALLLTALIPTAGSAATKTYQVTGPVLAVDASTISVQKGKETWILERDPAAKLTGAADIKVGDKVTLQYTMRAVEIEVKPAKGAAQAPAAGKKK